MERIYEMANRRKRQTRLPVNIWIDENGWYKLGGHAKRIKVQMNYGEKMQNQPFCCMDLYGNIIEDTFDEKECEVSTKDLRQVSNYVLNNSYALDKVADEEIFMEDYDEISIKGGKLVSLIDCNENDKIYTFGNPLITRLVSADCRCDKCQKKIGRAKYIVFSKTDDVQTRDDLIVLGTTCSKEYFPFDVESYFYGLELAFDELASLYDEERGSCSFRATTTDFDDVYYGTVACSDNLKVYVKQERQTRSLVDSWIADEKMWKNGPTYREYYPIPTTAISIEEMKEWINEAFNKDDSEIRNDFELNARTTFFATADDGTRTLRDRIPNKYRGIAIYGFFSAKQNHDKMVAKKIAEEERAKANAKVEYYGAVGDKFELTLTFDKSFGFEGAYGFTYIHLFHDDENHVFAWSSSNGTYQCWCKTNGKDGFLEYEVGKKYILKGTIKAHKEYRNVKQTVITRCKVLKDEYESHVFNKKEIEKDIESKELSENTVPYEDPFETMTSVEQSA